tara:strand:+ start:2151 stop:2552 length:402 start_codon:yes stop_codon:yes gene_type:complete
MRTNLLCTFTNPRDKRKTIDLIIDKYDILYNKIFLLKNVDNDRELMCTYNISIEENYSELENTILLHRKKQTNTLYTINALNSLIKILNNGVLDTTYQLDWENYRNTMLLTNEEGLKRVETEVEDIIYIKIKR